MLTIRKYTYGEMKVKPLLIIYFHPDWIKAPQQGWPRPLRKRPSSIRR